MADNNTFRYTYSAERQEEIDRIRKKYLPSEALTDEEDKMARLRALDKSATSGATVLALILGIFGCLVMGLGMCCCMVWMGDLMLPGILIGLFGIAAVISAYPVYHLVAARRRRRITPEILRLTEDLSA